METLTCPACSAPVQPGDLICMACGGNLARAQRPPVRPASESSPADQAPADPDGRAVPDDPAASADPGDPSTLSWTPFCPHCGADVPDIGNATCVECLRPLRPEPSPRTTLRVAFSSGEVKVTAGDELCLGRELSGSPVAGTFGGHDNVSRRHATLGLDDSGQAWVRDEGSTNGTFVNDRPLTAGHKEPLSDGDSLRLAADVQGRVSLG